MKCRSLFINCFVWLALITSYIVALLWHCRCSINISLSILVSVVANICILPGNMDNFWGNLGTALLCRLSACEVRRRAMRIPLSTAQQLKLAFFFPLPPPSAGTMAGLHVVSCAVPLIPNPPPAYTTPHFPFTPPILISTGPRPVLLPCPDNPQIQAPSLLHSLQHAGPN